MMLNHANFHEAKKNGNLSTYLVIINEAIIGRIKHCILRKITYFILV